MSLILDALKKSDQNRSRGKVPDLQADHSRILPDRPRRRAQRWLLPVLGLLLLLAGVGSWLLRPAVEPAAPVPAAIRQVIPAPPPPSPPPVAAVTDPAGIEVTAPVPARVAPPPDPAPVKHPPAPAPEDAILYAWADLPSHVRRSLPQLEVSLHYFTQNPTARMVRINGRILREGGEVPGGVRIEEIQRSGILCSAQGVRFLLPATGPVESDEEAR